MVIMIARGNSNKHRFFYLLVLSGVLIFTVVQSMLFAACCAAARISTLPYDAITPTPSTLHNGATCFVTIQMGADGNFMEPIQNLSALGIRLDHYRYIVVTNDEALDTKDWEKVILNLDTRKFPYVKTHVTYAKFLAWTLPELVSCSVIFVMDALNVPVDRADVWRDLKDRINSSPSGFLAQLKPGNTTNLKNLLSLPSMKKETVEKVQATYRWLLSRSDYNNHTLCLWTNFFGYKSSSIAYRTASADFWKLYTTTPNLTLRDQPLWSYVVERNNLRPAYFQSALEPRPHVHICAERDRILCKTTGGTCKKEKRNQHTLNGIINAYAIDCNKTVGAHKMSVLNTFVAG